MAYKGINTKTMKDGSKAILVRFKHMSKAYPIKNFTKLFSCKTEKQAFDKLQEIKLLITQNKDPFSSRGQTLDDYFYAKLKDKLEDGSWNKKTTAYAYKNFYEHIIKKHIGHKNLDKITYENLLDILKTILNTKGNYKNILKTILKPIFDEAIKKNIIYSSPVDLVKREKTTKKQKLTLRVVDNSLNISKKLYQIISEQKTIKNQNKNEMKTFLYMLLLTAHRYGELIQLTKEDVYLKKNLIISPSTITKTKEDYHFPIPQECIKYIKTIKKGLLFPNLKYGSISGIFIRIVKKTDIELYKDKKLTAHDTRNLMLNIMIRECKIDSMLADYCLDHKQSGVVEHYLDFNYEDKKIAYQKYWDIIK